MGFKILLWGEELYANHSLLTLQRKFTCIYTLQNIRMSISMTNCLGLPETERFPGKWHFSVLKPGKAWANKEEFV